MKNEFNTMSEAWINYAKMIIHPSASNTQIIETQRAFYSGAVSFLSILEKVADNPEAEKIIMDELKQEVCNFIFNRINQDMEK